ncbi:MAG: hypothetical protein WKF91_10285, partial [Segetibacter sp.]
AQFKDKMWGWNKQSKFQENAAAIRALKGAGGANINTALQGAISTGLNVNAQGGFGDMFGRKNTMDDMNALFNQQQFTNPGALTQALPYYDRRRPRIMTGGDQE